MKFNGFFNININKIFLFFFILLAISGEINSKNESTVYGHLKSRLESNNNESLTLSQIKVRTARYKNPLANLIGGIKNIFFPKHGHYDFSKCFPASWTENTEYYDKDKKSIFNFLTEFVTFFTTRVMDFFKHGPILSFICKYRQYAIDAIKGFLKLKIYKFGYTEKFREMENTGSEKERINRRNKYKKRMQRLKEEFIFRAIKSGINKVAEVGKKVYHHGKKIVGKALSYIQKAVISFLTKGVDFIVRAAKALGSFLKDFVGRLVSCFWNNKTIFLGTTFAVLMAKLKSKTLRYAAAAATGTALLYLGHDLLGFVCMKDENIATHNAMTRAFHIADHNEKAVSLGESIANLVKTYADAE